MNRTVLDTADDFTRIRRFAVFVGLAGALALAPAFWIARTGGLETADSEGSLLIVDVIGDAECAGLTCPPAAPLERLDRNPQRKPVCHTLGRSVPCKSEFATQPATASAT